MSDEHFFKHPKLPFAECRYSTNSGRYYKPHMHKTFRLNCRIELAKKLLQKGFGLSQVALECGFFDQSHFHRHFKAITTVTPKEYQVNFIQ